MAWLQRSAWWGLVGLTVIIGLFGLTDISGGITADPGIPAGITGKTPPELEAESASAYRLLDFVARVGGANLVVIGILMTTILLVPFRRGQRWAWWVMWTLPAWATAASLTIFIYGVAPGEAPPPPMISGIIFAILAAAILVVSAPRFFRSEA
jgi:hypothetical protein